MTVPADRLFLVMVALMVFYQLVLMIPQALTRDSVFAVLLLVLALSGPLLSRMLRLPITVLLLLLMIFGHLFLGNTMHGPFSIRLYAAGVLLGWMVFERVRYKKPIAVLPVTWVLIVLLSLLIGWRAIAMYEQSIPFEKIFDDNLPLVYAGGSFLAIQRFANSTRHISVVAIWLTMAIAMSSVVAIGQWLGFEPAWEAATRLRPGLEWQVRGLATPEAVAVARFAAGLATFSIQLSYQVLAFGFLGLAWFLHRFNILPSTLASASLFTLFGASLWIIQSRSALLAAVIGLLFLLVASNSKYRFATIPVVNARRLLIFSIAFTSLFAGIITFDQIPNGRRAMITNAYSLARVGTTSDRLRSTVMPLAVRTSISNPLFGVSPAEFDRLQVEEFPANDAVIAPHNLFLNASVYAGIPALVIVTGLLAVMSWEVLSAHRQSAGRKSVQWIATGAMAGFVGFTLNSQLHNDGLFNDGTLLWWIAGLSIALLAASSAKRPSHARGQVAS